VPPDVLSPWHLMAMGGAAHEVFVRAPPARESWHCTPPGDAFYRWTETGVSGAVFVELLTGFESTDGQAPSVCIFRMPAGAPLPAMPRGFTETRPTYGTWTSFLLADGTEIMAYGSAVARVRALLQANPRAPAPLPLAPGILQWQMTYEPPADRGRVRLSPAWAFVWQDSGANERVWTRYHDEHDAEVAASLADFLRPTRRGLDVFVARRKSVP
jgi:hypothetical protein